MRLLRRSAICLVLASGVLGTGCWGDEVPSLDQVGAMKTVDDEVAVLFGACPGEMVQRVELNLTDDKFEEIVRVLWAIEDDGDGSSEDVFLVGQLPTGFREITSLDRPLQSGDHVQVVVTSSESGAIPMSFTVDDLKTNEVLVRQNHYRSRVEFDDQVDDGCRS
jgi:hypothetical protein